jgi:hypothetical protein
MDLIVFRTPSEILQKHRNIDGIMMLNILFDLDILTIVNTILENDFSVLLRKMIRLYQYRLIQDNMKTACYYGSEECINILMQNGFVPTQMDIIDMIGKEFSSCLYLFMGMVSMDILIYESIRQNKLNCLDFLFSMNIPLDIKYVEYALERDRMDIVKYFVEVHQCISISIYQKAWDEKMVDFCNWLEYYFQSNHNEHMISLCRRIRYGKTPSPIQYEKEDMDADFEEMFKKRSPRHLTENEIQDIEFAFEEDDGSQRVSIGASSTDDEFELKQFEQKRRLFDTMTLFSSVPPSNSPMSLEDFANQQWK